MSNESSGSDVEFAEPIAYSDSELDEFHELNLDEDTSSHNTSTIPNHLEQNRADVDSIPSEEAADTTQDVARDHNDPSSTPGDDNDSTPSAGEPDNVDDFEGFDPDPERAKDAKERGNKLFGNADYLEALECYAEALLFVPDDHVKDRALYHNNKAAAHIMLKDWDDAIYEANCVLQLEPSNAKAIGRRAKSHEAKEQYQEAIEDYKLLMELEPNVPRHKVKVDQLTKKAEEKFEEQKKEMMTKLKGWGDSVLGLFGMSTDNFEFAQDPNTGSYSVNFKQ